jgi:dTMP kinase
MFHRRLREGFFELAHAEPKRFVIIDATQSIDDVAAAVQGGAKRLLGR